MRAGRRAPRAGRLAQRGEGDAALVDPACGDGAVVVEAAATACDLAPGLARDRWGFFGWAPSDKTSGTTSRRGRRAVRTRPRGGRGRGRVRGPRVDRPIRTHVRFAGPSTSSPAIARARVHAKRAGLRQAVSIEQGGRGEPPGSSSSSPPRSVRRLRLEEGSGRRLCTVASVLRAGERPSDANSQADAAAFAARGSAAPAGSTFAVAGGETVEARFGVAPAVRAELGRDRVETGRRSCSTSPRHGGRKVVVPIPPAAPSISWRCWSRPPSSSPHACSKWPRSAASGRAVKACRATASTMPTCPTTPWPSTCTRAQAMPRATRTCTSPSTLRPRRSIPPARAAASTTCWRSPPWCWASAPTTCSRRRAAATRAARSTATRAAAATSRRCRGRLPLEVDLSGYLDTGLFLDHRVTRELVGDEGRRGSVSSTCSPTRVRRPCMQPVAAPEHCDGGLVADLPRLGRAQYGSQRLRGGAAYLRTRRYDGVGHRSAPHRPPLRPRVRRSAHVLQLQGHGQAHVDVQRDHVELLIGVSRLLSEEGEAVFSCNLRSFKPDEEALAKYGVTLEDITAQTIPHDFERNPRIHKCYLVKRTQ